MENLAERNKEREDRLNTLLRESESRHCEIYIFLNDFLDTCNFVVKVTIGACFCLKQDIVFGVELVFRSRNSFSIISVITLAYLVAQQRSELQQMLEAEIQVCNEMKNECKKLTQQLQDSSENARYFGFLSDSDFSFSRQTRGKSILSQFHI